MLPSEGLKIIVTEEHRAKICMDMICEFLHQRPDYSMSKPNMNVKDYSLEQFQRRVGKRIKYSEKSADKKKRNSRLEWIRNHNKK